jgi:hypothetical protein
VLVTLSSAFACAISGSLARFDPRTAGGQTYDDFNVFSGFHGAV